jgi:hypothetical protein
MNKRIAVTLVVLLASVECLHAQSQAPAPATDPAKPAVAAVPPPNDTPIIFETGGSPPASDRIWGSVDYLFSWTRGTNLPPLVTTSPAGTAQTSAGVLGKAGTSILFGSSDVDSDMRSGLRFDMGGWITADRFLGIDVGFSVLESRNALFYGASTGTPILARPFTDLASGTATATSQLVAFPGVSSGSIAAAAGAGNVYDLHVDLMQGFGCPGGLNVEPLLGYRVIRFSDRLAVNQSVVSAGAAGVVAGTTVATSDTFTSQDIFEGADFGIRLQYATGPVTWGGLFKLAVGDTSQSIGIEGLTHVTVPGTPTVTNAGGMLALSSNTGTHNSDSWVVIPELGTDLDWKVTSFLHLRLGYSFLYWYDVARAAEQVSLTLNSKLFPPAQSLAGTTAAPTFTLHKTDMWIQSLNLGLEFRY